MSKKYILILSLFTIIIFALGAYAAEADTVSIRIGDMEISFLPLVFTSRAADPPPGVLYVFSSSTTTTGSAGGHTGIRQICPTDDPDSHFCSLGEIELAWDSTGIHFEDPLPIRIWVDNYSSDWVGENCVGWISSGAEDGWAIVHGTPNLEACGQDLPLACCKWVP